MLFKIRHDALNMKIIVSTYCKCVCNETYLKMTLNK